MSSQPIIEMQAVTKNYPMGEVTVHALRGLDLAVTRGEFIVLLGPSGSGKTTTLNLVGGLVQRLPDQEAPHALCSNGQECGQ
jgi:putative ABC transport system ATP-binding protein